MNKYVRGVIGALIAFGLFLAGNYLISLIKGQPFDPEWIYNIGLAVLVGILTIYGPDAAQAKKNRERLKDSFRKK